MDSLTVLKQDDSEELLFLIDPSPLSNPSIRLDVPSDRKLYNSDNPLILYYSPVRPLSHIFEILGGLHYFIISSAVRYALNPGALPSVCADFETVGLKGMCGAVLR